FYTNGCAVLNREHEVMPNGDTLNHSSFKEITGWDDCAYGYPGTQNLAILDDPGNEQGYYLLHKTIVETSDYANVSFISQLRNTYIDISLDDGYGDVVYFDSVLMNEHPISAYLAAMRHQNGRDWWVVQPLLETSEYATFLIDTAGIHRMPNQESFQFFDVWFSGASGTARFSPDGTKYAYYNRYDNLHLYDFDRATGTLSNHQFIEIFPTVLDTFDFQFGSVEWSPNSRFLYVTNRDSLHQIDTWQDNILEGGIRLIDVYNGTLDPFPTNFFIMVLGPDCRIYMCSTNGSNSFHIINHPDELGTACGFVQNGLGLPGHSGPSLPFHTRWRVDEEDKCDPSIVSVFGLDVFYRRALLVYPNPTAGPLSVELPKAIGAGHVEVYDLAGRLMLHQAVEPLEERLEVNLAKFPAGHYHVEVYPEDNPGRVFYGAQVVKR
ncbi:MAG: T9SS type A sorting domain-containing protein, partial [Phaeodactylibacter sp.]|nr:T9SS type A sorting domain-containing protein [Phaeodactylibacter sp.]